MRPLGERTVDSRQTQSWANFFIVYSCLLWLPLGRVVKVIAVY